MTLARRAMVAFGNDFLQSQISEHRLHYVDYDGLKRALEDAAGEPLGELLQASPLVALEMQNNNVPTTTHATHFLTLLERELSKCDAARRHLTLRHLEANSSDAHLRTLRPRAESTSSSLPSFPTCAARWICYASKRVSHRRRMRLCCVLCVTR